VRFYVFTSFVFFALLGVYLSRSVEVLNKENDTPRKHLRRAHISALIGDSISQMIGWDSVSKKFGAVDVPVDKPYYRPEADALRSATPRVVDSLLKVAEVGADDTAPGCRQVLANALSRLPVADSMAVNYVVDVNGLEMSFFERKEEALFRRGNISEEELTAMLGPEADSLSWLEKKLLMQITHVNMNTDEGRKQVTKGVVKVISILMFVLMPFTALLLLWIFYRKRYYWEHLIFSIHTHTIYFLFFTVITLVALLTPGDWPEWSPFPVLFVCFVYLLLSLRTVYGKGWLVTLFRLIVMAVPYFLVFVVLLTSGLLLGLFSL
jgi:hypothetical protein